MKITITTILIIITTLLYSQEKQPTGAPIGSKGYIFKAITQDSTMYSLSDSLKKGPVVVLFYRGQWCPVCNRHLSNLQDSLHLIYEKGASVVAISPEKPKYLNKTAEKTGAQFTLVHDEEYKICNAYKVTFTLDKKTKLLYDTWFGKDFKNAHSDNSGKLPVPATYILNQKGEIIWKQFDTDYKNRAAVSEILKQL